MGPLFDVALDPATLPVVLGINGRKWLALPPFCHILRPLIDTMELCSVFNDILLEFFQMCSVRSQMKRWENTHRGYCLLGSDVRRTHFDVLGAEVVKF